MIRGGRARPWAALGTVVTDSDLVVDYRVWFDITDPLTALYLDESPPALNAHRLRRNRTPDTPSINLHELSAPDWEPMIQTGVVRCSTSGAMKAVECGP